MRKKLFTFLCLFALLLVSSCSSDAESIGDEASRDESEKTAKSLPKEITEQDLAAAFEQLDAPDAAFLTMEEKATGEFLVLNSQEESRLLTDESWIMSGGQGEYLVKNESSYLKYKDVYEMQVELFEELNQETPVSESYVLPPEVEDAVLSKWLPVDYPPYSQGSVLRSVSQILGFEDFVLPDDITFTHEAVKDGAESVLVTLTANGIQSEVTLDPDLQIIKIANETQVIEVTHADTSERYQEANTLASNFFVDADYAATLGVAEDCITEDTVKNGQTFTGVDASAISDECIAQSPYLQNILSLGESAQDNFEEIEAEL